MKVFSVFFPCYISLFKNHYVSCGYMKLIHTITSLMMMLLQMLQVYQPLHDEQQQQQQQSTTMVQPTGAAQPVTYTVPSAPAVCELYASCQSKIVGIILIIAGASSIVFNIVAIILFEIWTYYGQGFWCGIMVSSSKTL